MKILYPFSSYTSENVYLHSIDGYVTDTTDKVILCADISWYNAITRWYTTEVEWSGRLDSSLSIYCCLHHFTVIYMKLYAVTSNK